MFCMLCRGPRLVGAGIMRAALGMMTTGGVLGWLPVGPRRCDLGTRTPTLSWHTQRLLYGTPGPTSIFGFVALSIARSLLQVHKAWHAAGVAPELYSATPVGDRSMVMVVMEHLREEDGWKALSEVPRKGMTQELQEAVREALRKAHAAKLPCGRTAAHGDVRGPNVLVRTTKGGGSAPEVRFIDFDWWVWARASDVDEMLASNAC